MQLDELGRNALDISCYLNFKNIALYLMVKVGNPEEFITSLDLNIDKEGRSCYHVLAYKGHYDVLTTMLNYERACMKKMFSDQLQGIKGQCKFNNLDIKHGELVSTTFHDKNTVRRHADFNLRATTLFEQYTGKIIERCREIFEC